MISIDTARQLLDFGGRADNDGMRVSSGRAESQLAGAVAIHNILERDRVAYLADEVGMGKTYVALGAFALFRHFNPRFRMLVIAPKENIQHKWVKEYRNFVRNNVLFADLRVKALHHVPARSPVVCDNLLHFIRETSLDPDRDFFVRMTSFSMGLLDDTSTWSAKADAVLKALPWLDPALFSSRSKQESNKQQFKDNFARALCCALPQFDLIILDEAHNLKGGLGSKASRNRVLALSMGQPVDDEALPKGFRHYGPRARRLLLLSATPLEDDFAHVRNQLSVFGFQNVAAGLDDNQKTDEEKKALLSRFMVRRVNEVKVAGQDLTKNMYRREWRGGGVHRHDEPLPQANDHQRLVVALVQKKVSELLESETFNQSFQIGLLASFESFLQTARVRSETEFFDGDQTDREEEKGIDIHAVDGLAASYWRRFRQELPHPKMDALVKSLRQSFETGEKALVFVRRVASVKELQQKLESEYDQWLLPSLTESLRSSLQTRFGEIVEQYKAERRSKQNRPQLETLQDETRDLDDDSQPAHPDLDDPGGNETFFAWFFRGKGPASVLSGAHLSLRLNAAQFGLSSFFLDNWVAALLEAKPGAVLSALHQRVGGTEAELRHSLENLAGSIVPIKKRKTHKELFLAFQFAGLTILSRSEGELGEKASLVLRELFNSPAHTRRPLQLGNWLETPTFFTELRTRQALKDKIWPDDQRASFAKRFRHAELRRELIASMCRLGHPLIDLWILYVNQVARLDTRSQSRTEDDSQALARAFLDLLENQRNDRTATSWHELQQAAEHFDLIVDTNVPSIRERSLTEAPTELGKLLGEQQPVVGMSGTVNRTAVRQFRMPGYPRTLITTELLQEGEDLHLFCSKIYHYGITWMPSSMEQRTGRIDRVRSQSERRLNALTAAPVGDDLIQVYYPYLQETVEVFQVNRVFERLNQFLRLMHERFGEGHDDEDRKIDVAYEATRGVRSIAPVTEALRSAFPVQKQLIGGPRRPLAVSPTSEGDLMNRFNSLALSDLRLPVEWKETPVAGMLLGTFRRDRQQPFTLLVRSVDGKICIRCVSPVGRVDPRADTERISREARSIRAKVCAVYDTRFNEYDLTVEGDVVLGSPRSDAGRVRWLIKCVVEAADRLEAVLLETDHDADAFKDGLEREVDFER